MMHNLSVMQRDRLLAHGLRVPLYAPNGYIPFYREVDCDSWRIAHCPFHLEHGYISGLWGVSGMPVFMRYISNIQGWENWRSLTPYEIESQELAWHHAHGHAVVIGLGMGWTAINMALNPAVIQVSVIEHDPQLIALLALSGAMDGLSEEVRKKIRIVQADVLEWVCEEPVNFLYIDTRADLDDAQVQKIYAHVKADIVYFWGQEIRIFNVISERMNGFRNAVSPKLLRHFLLKTFELPLLITETPDYLQRIETVMAMRQKRGLT